MSINEQNLRGQCLRLLSYNIHVGRPSHSLKRYLIETAKNIWPDNDTRADNLKLIANLAKDFDLVALQELDTGSLRSGFVNQLEYLALQANFPHWYQQLNRNLGHYGQYSNGLLSRYSAKSLKNHKLPGIIPGRGAMLLEFGSNTQPLLVINVHLALSKRARNQQLAYLCEIMQDYQHIILMGDMNCRQKSLLEESPLRHSHLIAAYDALKTYPSWKPTRDLDHIFITPSLKFINAHIINQLYSDHLAIAVEIELPQGLLIH